MHAPKVTKEHAWLQKLVGDWSGEGTAEMGPGQPPQQWTVDEHVRAIGDVWIQAESRGTMPDGSPSVMQITLGYDPDAQRFRGTFVGSMMTYLWTYDGSLDAEERVLTLDAEGPNMAEPGKMSRYQDIVELVDADERRLSSRIQMPDGSWQQFMTVRYRRKT
jgi:hypothetical protein